MNRLLRRITLLLIAGGFGVARVACAGQGQRSPEKSSELTPELQALLAAVQPSWATSGDVEADMGYKDNLLLSRTDPAKSAYIRAGFESLLWHPARGKIDYFGFVNGNYTRYLKRTTDEFGTTVDHEAEAFAGFEWRFRQPQLLNLTFDAQGYYLDQIFDISDPSVTRSIAALKVNGIKGGPTIRLFIYRGLWVEGNVMADRQKFADGLNDARIREATGRLGWTINDRVELSVGKTERRRDFDHRTRVAPGITLRGLLVTHEHEGEGRVDVTWGADRHWITHTRAGVRRYEDNGIGYLNFHERHITQEIQWSAGGWHAEMDVETRRKQYDNQYAEAGSAPPPIVKNDISATLRVERDLSAHWTLFAESNYERSRSNDLIASYRMKEGLLGARWSWEK